MDQLSILLEPNEQNYFKKRFHDIIFFDTYIGLNICRNIKQIRNQFFLYNFVMVETKVLTS